MSALFRNTIVADAYATHRDRVDVEFMEVLESLVVPGELIVDIGAGVGAPAAYLQSKGHDVVAIEPSGAMIAQGANRHAGVNFVRAFGEDLPVATASVGTAILMYVMHHVTDPVAVFQETKRILKSNGKAIIVSGDPDSPRQEMFRDYFPTLLPDLPTADEIWWWGCEAQLTVETSTIETHWVHPHAIIDDSYIDMVTCQMFDSLRALNPREFDAGVRKMKQDAGRPLLPPQVSVTTMQPANINNSSLDEQLFEVSQHSRALQATLLG